MSAATQRCVVRIALGVYLFVHYAALLPYAAELFSRDGALPNAATSPFFGRIPNPLFVWDQPAVAALVVAAGALFALLLACGVRTRSVALASWAVSAMLFMRDPLIANPALPFVGLLLLVHVFFPEHDSDCRPWHRLTSAYGLVFVVLAVGYSYSGVTKLLSPSWLDGSALRHVLENPLARPSVLRDMLLATPPGFLRAMTYGVLALEIAFAPLCLWRPTRALAWGAMVGMHLGILVLVDFADLTLGILLVHAFTFDPAWLAARRRALRSSPTVRTRLAAANLR
jgi:hypothetical protein